MPRPQDKHLKSLADRTTSERREIARKGGKASGEARRKKHTMRESFEAVLAVQTTDRFKAAFKKQGFEVENLTNEQAMVLSLTAKAIAGDTRAASIVMDVMGSKFSDTLREREISLKEQQIADQKSEALDKLDDILRGLHEQAANDEETE